MFCVTCMSYVYVYRMLCHMHVPCSMHVLSHCRVGCTHMTMFFSPIPLKMMSTVYLPNLWSKVRMWVWLCGCGLGSMWVWWGRTFLPKCVIVFSLDVGWHAMGWISGMTGCGLNSIALCTFTSRCAEWIQCYNFCLWTDLKWQDLHHGGKHACHIHVTCTCKYVRICMLSYKQHVHSTLHVLYVHVDRHACTHYETCMYTWIDIICMNMCMFVPTCAGCCQWWPLPRDHPTYCAGHLWQSLQHGYQCGGAHQGVVLWNLHGEDTRSVGWWVGGKGGEGEEGRGDERFWPNFVL